MCVSSFNSIFKGIPIFYCIHRNRPNTILIIHPPPPSLRGGESPGRGGGGEVTNSFLSCLFFFSLLSPPFFYLDRVGGGVPVGLSLQGSACDQRLVSNTFVSFKMQWRPPLENLGALHLSL